MSNGDATVQRNQDERGEAEWTRIDAACASTAARSAGRTLRSHGEIAAIA